MAGKEMSQKGLGEELESRRGYGNGKGDIVGVRERCSDGVCGLLVGAAGTWLKTVDGLGWERMPN